MENLCIINYNRLIIDNYVEDLSYLIKDHQYRKTKVKTVTPSYDGKLLAVTFSLAPQMMIYNTKIYDISQNKFIYDIDEEPENVYFCSDNKRLALKVDGYLQIYDLNFFIVEDSGFKLLKYITLFYGDYISHDFNYYLCIVCDKLILYNYNVRAHLVKRFEVGQSHKVVPSFSHCGEYLVYATRRHLIIYSLRQKVLCSRISILSTPIEIQFDRDLLILYIYSINGKEHIVLKLDILKKKIENCFKIKDGEGFTQSFLSGMKFKCGDNLYSLNGIDDDINLRSNHEIFGLIKKEEVCFCILDLKGKYTKSASR